MQSSPLDYFSMLTGMEFSRHNPEVRNANAGLPFRAHCVEVRGLCSPRVLIKMEIEPHSEIFGISLFKTSNYPKIQYHIALIPLIPPSALDGVEAVPVARGGMGGQDFFANGAPAGCFRGAIFFKQPDPLGKRISPCCPDVQALNIFEPRSYRMNTNKTERR